jgi:predicted Zn-dependent peptidase
MLRKYLSSFFALLTLWTILVAPIASAQTPSGPAASQTPPAPVTAPEQKTSTSLKSGTPAQFAEAQAALVTEFDVNGLKVLVKRRSGSQSVAAGLFIRGGSGNLTEKNAGIEGLMLDVATEATVGFPRERLRTESARMATIIGSGANYDYSALSMASTRDNFDRSWEIFTDIALRPSFTNEDFERVKSRTVLSLRDDVDSPDSFEQTLLDRMIYAGHPYANSPRGNADIVSKLTVEDVRRYHTQMMQTTRLLLVVVGDLDPATVRGRVTATFGKLPRGNYQPQAVSQLTFTTPAVEVTQRTLPTNYVQGIFTAPPMTADDIHPMRIASNILAQLVYQEVREKRNLSYAPDAFLNSQGANIGGISVTAVDANQAVRVMLDQISVLQNNSLLPQIISNVVAGYLTNYYIRLETNSAQAGELAQYELIGGGWRNSITIIDRLRAVTPEDVQRVSQKYMRNIRFVVVGNSASIDKNVFLSQQGD